MDLSISVDEAQSAVVDRAPRLSAETVSLDDSPGRTLAEPVASEGPLPPFDNTAMDGYAVRAADIDDPPVELPLAFEVELGTGRTLPPGACARITTGQPLPPGADGVIRQERTERTDGAVRVLRSVDSGQNVRPAGEDVAADETILEAGAVVTSAAVRLLAGVGRSDVPVRRRPEVGILTTGDELVAPDASPGPGQIRDSNGPALAAQVRSVGGRPLRERRPDDRAALRRAFRELATADVLCVVGGMSVGSDDLVRDVLEALGATWHFVGVRQRPGKPFGFGQLDGTLLFGLPGNPVSAAVCFEAYVRPALAAMLGRDPVFRPRVPATLSTGLRVKAGYHYFVRGVAAYDDAGCLTVRSTGHQGSGISRSMWAANCLAHVAESVVDPEAGDRVQVEWLSERW